MVCEEKPLAQEEPQETPTEAPQVAPPEKPQEAPGEDPQKAPAESEESKNFLRRELDELSGSLL